SGRVKVSTKDGFETDIGQGDFFGEGALLSAKARRNATIRCVTPVHAIEISKEYFDKYLKDGHDAEISLREKHRMRARARAQSILQLQESLEPLTLQRGQYVYKQGEAGNDLFLIEDGMINVTVDGHTVFTSGPGGVCGEYGMIFGRPRNTSAVCVSDQCKLQIMEVDDFKKVTRSNPSIAESLREVALRRQFQKALVYATKKPFPTKEAQLREAFNTADCNHSGQIDLSDVAEMLKKMDHSFTDRDIAEILNSLDLDDDGAVKWDEFMRVFGMGGTRFEFYRGVRLDNVGFDNKQKNLEAYIPHLKQIENEIRILKSNEAEIETQVARAMNGVANLRGQIEIVSKKRNQHGHMNPLHKLKCRKVHADEFEERAELETKLAATSVSIAALEKEQYLLRTEVATASRLQHALLKQCFSDCKRHMCNASGVDA
ncbi:MAG: hypothetical protein SGILL_001115, partial [Bacillariaceae sp.]